MTNRVAVFIDAGYLVEVLKGFNLLKKINYHQLVTWACGGDNLLRTYYYDCLPYQSKPPTAEERDRKSKVQKFFTALESGDSPFIIRPGRLEFRGYEDKGKPKFIQKRIDVQIGMDMLILVEKRLVEIIIIITGDSDFIPAVEYVQQKGVIVRLVHGPKNTCPCHQDLWRLVDERKEITEELLYKIKLQ